MEEMKDLSEIKNDINNGLNNTDQNAVNQATSNGSNETVVLHQEGADEFPEIGDENDDDDVGLIITKKQTTPQPQNNPNQSPQQSSQEYDGKGFVIDAPVNKPQGDFGIKTGALANPERVDSIKDTFKEMDEQIAEAREKAMQRAREEQAARAAGKRIEETDTVEVVLDKTGLGTITFTEEEKARLEKAKKIRLIEVEDKELKTLKVKKKIRKRDEFKILKKNFDKSFSPVMALASGYTCKMKNISAIEAIRMYQRPGRDTANSILEKWSLIYDKIIDISRGPFENIEDFLHHTAFHDYENFVFAMIASSYPTDDAVEFVCDKDLGGCGKSFTVDYQNTTMIRQDLIKDNTRKIMGEIINNAPFVDKAREYAEKAPVNFTKRFFIDDTSGIIVEIYIPSVHDIMKNYFEEIQNNEELLNTADRDLVILAQGIKSIFVPDYEEDDGSFYQAEGVMAIVETLQDLTTPQLQVITNKTVELTEPYTIRYGFKNVVCPHCKHDFGQYTMNLDSILFQRVQQQVTTEIE